MTAFETDYLVVGAGATGLAFADTLLQHSDAHITLVDRRAQPGGHWCDAYPFVTLHQPSSLYGVDSLALGSGRIDTVGPNAGLHELASGAEVSAYFHQVMHQQLLPSGRVRWLPMSDCTPAADGSAQVRSLLCGAQTTVTVRRKTVDATWLSPQVPATAPPRFAVAAGVRLLTPTQLTGLWQDPAGRPARYCILGAGKTAMDVAVWLLSAGVPPDDIHWVVPRDAWLLNRLGTQPGLEFFEHSIGAQLVQMQALAEASDVADLYARLEAGGVMMRIDPAQTPRLFHYATLSEGEVRLLRQIRQVIRRGRVQAVTADGLVLEQGREALPPGTVYVHCTASAVDTLGRPDAAVPIFQPGRIVPQLLRVPHVVLSAALCAYVEAHHADDAAKNALCTPVPFPRDPGGFVASTLGSVANQVRWTQDKPLRSWMRNSRLDGFGKMAAGVDSADTARMALLGALRQQTQAAMANGPRLMARAAAAAGRH